jgi:hypothetical protein
VKRSEALAGLSRDHHGALFVAMKLRRADAATIGEALTSFEAYWERTGDHHFDEEERVLIGALPDDSPGWTDACARMVAEHVDLRARGAALPSLSGDEQLTAAHELGERLSDHVRFEERELFVMLEERLDDEALQALGEALDH